MNQETYIYRLPSGDASLIEPLSASGFFELSASSFSKNHLLKALAEALTLLHNQNKPFLESQQQNTSEVPANEQTQPSVALVACAAEAHSSFVVDETDFVNLIGFCTVMGAVANKSEDWQRVFFKNFLSLLTSENHILSAKLSVLLNAHIATSDHYASFGDKGLY